MFAKFAASTTTAAAARDRRRGSLRVDRSGWSAPRAAYRGRCSSRHGAPWCTGALPMVHHSCCVSHRCLQRRPAVPRCASASPALGLSSSRRLASPARAAHLGAPWCSCRTCLQVHHLSSPADPQVPLLPAELFGRVRRAEPHGLDAVCRGRGTRRRRGAASARRWRPSKGLLWAVGGEPCEPGGATVAVRGGKMCVLAGLAGPEPPPPSRGF